MMLFKSLFVFVALTALSSGVHAAPVWLTDLSKAQAQAKTEGKFVLVNFTGSDWCGWCIKLRKEVLLKAEFGDYAKTNLVLVEVDFPKRKPQPAALQNTNRKLAEQFQVQSFPTLVVLDGRGTRVGLVNYSNGGPKPFLAELEKVIHPPPDSLPAKATAKAAAGPPPLRRPGVPGGRTTSADSR
jgi:protein disulfide-isomerase